MKRIILLFLLISFCGIYTYAENSDKYSDLFIVRFLQCFPYSGTYTSDDVTISRKVLRWKNSLCRYSETITQNNVTTSYNCNFTREQINALITAMKNDPNGAQIADAVWNGYRKDQSVCTAGN